MGKKEKKNEEAQPGNSWLITYADMCTLLLTFFILLLSMSIIDEERQRKVLDSLVGAFGFLSGGRSALGVEKGTDPREFSSPMVKARPVDVDMLKEMTMRNNLDDDIKIIEEKDRIIIRLNSRLLFEPGSTVLLPSIESYLASLADHLARGGKKMEVQGHTDVREVMHSADVDRFSWMLSSLRALAVHDFFLQKGVAYHLVAAHGYSHIHPVRDGLKYIDFFEENRRVDIVVSENVAIPAHLNVERREARPDFKYKNFLFRFLHGDGN